MLLSGGFDPCKYTPGVLFVHTHSHSAYAWIPSLHHSTDDLPIKFDVSPLRYLSNVNVVMTRACSTNQKDINRDPTVRRTYRHNAVSL